MQMLRREPGGQRQEWRQYEPGNRTATSSQHGTIMAIGYWSGQLELSACCFRPV